MQAQPPDASAAQRLRSAILLHQQGRFRDAEQHYRAALEIDGSNFDCLHNLGLLFAQQSRFEEAVEFFRAATQQNPRSIEALNNFGNVLAILNRHEEAIASYRNAIAVQPGYADAHNNLGIALAATKRNEEAIAHYRKALSINPRFTKAHNNLGNVLGSALGRHEEAVTCYEQGLAIAPNDPEIRNNLGVSLAALDRAEQAVAQYARALALRPSYAEAHNNLAATLETLFRFEEAAAHCRKAITIRLDYPEAHNTLGNVLKALDRHSEALECYQKAIKLRPDYAQACSNMGDTLRELGRADEARRSYQTAVALSPDTPRFLRRLVESTSMTAHDPHMASLRGLAEDTTLATEEQIELQFALAKALGDIGEPAQAFRHLAQGNALKRRTIRYDETATLGLLDRIQAQFTPAMMQPRQGRGNRSVVPVFVVGMIRSGTTLVEQILASHPDVHGAGERTDFANLLARGIHRPDGALVRFPESFATISGAELEQLGSDYLRGIEASAPPASRIVDKMPRNFRFAGAIHLALPNARIIHVHRDPIDTCVSCFSILFAGDQPFAYDLGELGRYYRAYRSLMEHWRGLLPPQVMLEIKYEELIADTEQQARRIVAHCGLAWNDNCLAFHQTPRPVRTASALQVRRPIYQTSVGRWLAYRDQLGPLFAALKLEPPGLPQSPGLESTSPTK